MAKIKRLSDVYKFPGCRPQIRTKGIFGDPKALIIKLIRRQKKRGVGPVGQHIKATTIKGCEGYEIYPVETGGFTLRLKSGESIVEGAGK